MTDVIRLTAEDTGRWWVRTQGSEHLFDLDAGTYERHQLDGLNPMRQDRETLPLPKQNILQWPTVDNVFIINVPVALRDLNDRQVHTIRRSSLIRQIVSAD